MGTTRTAWHVLLAAFFEQWGSRRFECRSEVPLSSEPLRGDFLFLRREGEPAVEPRVPSLRGLWDLLPREAILEFKSVGRPYRSRSLHRLLSYLHLYFCDQTERLAAEAELCGVLLIAARTPSLQADALAMRLRWRDLGGGYARLEGGVFALYVVEIDVVADCENDDMLRLFGHDDEPTTEAKRWLAEQIGTTRAGMTMEQLEEYDEIVKKLLATLSPEQRMAGLPPEQRMAGLPPEQRLVGLPAEEQILALSVDVLRGLPDAYLATLSEPTRAKIRARIGR
jgi:hypothetical protein